jgi:hypothetical protein
MGKAVIVKLPLQLTDPDKYLAEQTKSCNKAYLHGRVQTVVDSLRANGSQLKTVFEEAYAVLIQEGHTIKSHHVVRSIYYGIYSGKYGVDYTKQSKGKQSKNHSHK